VSARVIGRGKCPKCGREGSVVLKEISGRVYVYFKHGRDWCYIGPLDRVNLAELITELRPSPYHNITTKLGSAIKGLVTRLGRKPLKYVLVEILAIFLLVIGSLIAVLAVLALLSAITSTGTVMEAYEERSVSAGDAFIINAGTGGVSSIECLNCSFVIGSKKSLIGGIPAHCINTVVCPINTSHIDASKLSTEEVTRTIIENGDPALIKISKAAGRNPTLKIRLTKHVTIHKETITPILAVTPATIIAGLMIWAGIKLRRWLKGQG